MSDSEGCRGLEIGELKIPVPVIQGGMGVGVSLSGLAGAVAAAGGIGVISAAQIGFREPDFGSQTRAANMRALKREIEQARARCGKGVIGVNIMTAMNHYEDYVRTAAESGADIIISGAGLPVDLPAITREYSVKLAPIVSSRKAAAVLSRMWDRKYQRQPDLLIVEGPAAGGHLGFTREQAASMTREAFDAELLSIISYARELEEKRGCRIPVIAAGGIWDRSDMIHYQKLGTDGVQLGTRFITTIECDADMRYKEVFLKSRKEDVVLVDSPVGMPGRAIKTPFLQRISEHKEHIGKCYRCLKSCDPAQIPYCITQALVQAVSGNIEAGLVFSGSNGWRAEQLETVDDIMREFSIKQLPPEI